MSYAYYYCSKLSGNAYFYSQEITNVKYCFKVGNREPRLNIYVIKDSVTNDTIHITNSLSLGGTTITWTDEGAYQYNTQYNIYIYPVANVEQARIDNGD